MIVVFFVVVRWHFPHLIKWTDETFIDRLPSSNSRCGRKQRTMHHIHIIFTSHSVQLSIELNCYMLIYCYHQYITATALLHARQIPARINKEKKNGIHKTDERSNKKRKRKENVRTDQHSLKAIQASFIIIFIVCSGIAWIMFRSLSFCLNLTMILYIRIRLLIWNISRKVFFVSVFSHSPTAPSVLSAYMCTIISLTIYVLCSTVCTVSAWTGMWTYLNGWCSMQ